MNYARIEFIDADLNSRFGPSYLATLLEFSPSLLQAATDSMDPEFSPGDPVSILQQAINSLPLNPEFASKLQVGDVLTEFVLSGEFGTYAPETDQQKELIRQLNHTNYVGVVTGRTFGKVGHKDDYSLTYGLIVEVKVVPADDVDETKAEALRGEA